jgi:hypothetical protein
LRKSCVRRPVVGREDVNNARKDEEDYEYPPEIHDKGNEFRKVRPQPPEEDIQDHTRNKIPNKHPRDKLNDWPKEPNPINKRERNVLTKAGNPEL